MFSKLSGWDDTIVALATPPGIGAIGVIRVSGKQTFAIVDKLFTSRNLLEQASHTIHVGFLKQAGETIDEVVVSLFKGPRSYTGEDVIEISCHGSPYIQQQIIEACITEGARLAKPGEFTLRAFLNGKMDLAQAEAVADLIASSTKASRDTALHAMRGGFSEVLAELREEMVKFSALIELELDFSQEDVEFADRTQFYALLQHAGMVTGKLLESFKYGNVIKNGVRVAIVGKPNAGKSTLLNQLLNENRAIVSDIAGTTRDTIEEVLNIEGILFRLIDTAGIREHTADVIERAGIEKTQEKIKEADVVMYVFDVNEIDVAELNGVTEVLKSGGANVLLVGNKIDVHGEEHAREKFASLLLNNIDRDHLLSNDKHSIGVETLNNGHAHVELVLIAASKDNGIEALKQQLSRIVLEGNVHAEDTVVTNARHYEALKSVDSALKDIVKGLDAGITTDLIALDIRRCLHYLGEITGEITNDEQLSFIFGKFCIGK